MCVCVCVCAQRFLLRGMHRKFDRKCINMVISGDLSKQYMLDLRNNHSNLNTLQTSLTFVCKICISHSKKILN